MCLHLSMMTDCILPNYIEPYTGTKWHFFHTQLVFNTYTKDDSTGILSQCLLWKLLWRRV